MVCNGSAVRDVNDVIWCVHTNSQTFVFGAILSCISLFVWSLFMLPVPLQPSRILASLTSSLPPGCASPSPHGGWILGWRLSSLRHWPTQRYCSRASPHRARVEDRREKTRTHARKNHGENLFVLASDSVSVVGRLFWRSRMSPCVALLLVRCFLHFFHPPSPFNCPQCVLELASYAKGFSAMNPRKLVLNTPLMVTLHGWLDGNCLLGVIFHTALPLDGLYYRLPLFSSASSLISSCLYERMRGCYSGLAEVFQASTQANVGIMWPG